ncbi:TetR/AcrR family transcriptional regulator [Phaeobacter sp. J2-8]|uniref:TetR/AcrR family transcriptional regulator n=1 Tax=Phaeobacter sp. J2-8 TaxID=2931394 RepID=UPI001FCFAEAC|nr:TetR/AcrR family transcriptional regulator [Phaeobacter sp. J2-8]MCJ7871166.1 TetR/AcrR family transcriptional regulator [Phaeobacter sp. J2-8]
MPRAKSKSRENLLDNALNTFWKTGFHVVSMGDLVRETGVSRAGIYSDFGGKEDLFHACLDRYQDTVVTPAFAPVEAEGAGIEGIKAYFDNLLARFEDTGGFGMGCLVGNTLSQIPEDAQETRQRLRAHCDRLTAGFHKVLTYENGDDGPLSVSEIAALARYTMLSVQGIWSYSRLTGDVAELRAASDMLIAVLKARLRGAPD